MTQLTDHAGYLLRIAFLRIAAIAADTFPRDAHPRDASVLATLEASGPCSQQELATGLNVNPTMMVKLIDSLEARALVERRRNPRDRRSYALVLTEAGRQALVAMGPRMDAAEGRFAAALDAAERERLIELLHALMAPPEMSVSRRLGFLISKAHHMFREVADGAVEPYGIEIRHFAALTALADGVPSQRELADRLRVSTPVVVEIVDSLEAAGLVERRRDPGDRRSNALVVTDAGRTTLARATDDLQAVSRVLIAPIGEQGDAELRALLAKLLEL